MDFYKINQKSDLKLSVEKGWVTLEGWVEEPRLKDELITVINRIYGVVVITEKIAVVPSRAREDILIAKEIIDVIDKNENINTEKINVRVNKKRVRIAGKVSNWKARNEVLHIAESLRKVLPVEEDIMVAA